MLTSIALIHPYELTKDLVLEINHPLCLLPSKNEELDMESWYRQLMTRKKAELVGTEDKKRLEVTSIYRRFHDMKHGFAAARGDWENLETRRRVQEVLEIVTSFFTKTLCRHGDAG
jgi:hypothetical protein